MGVCQEGMAAVVEEVQSFSFFGLVSAELEHHRAGIVVACPSGVAGPVDGTGGDHHLAGYSPAVGSGAAFVG